MMSNKGYLKSAIVLLAACILVSCDEEEPDVVHTPDPSTARTIDQGSLVGFTADNGAKTWLAVPYAEPPVGHLRWRAPREPSPWYGQLQALQHPDWCPQITMDIDEFSGIPAGELRGSEDCLYLNIYAPSAPPPAEGWPVMVWVHGGRNIWGRAAQYDGSVLAEEQGVVVVIVQYRLGPLGAFSHPELRENLLVANDASPNFGLLDIVAALEWVQGNIYAFGGDNSRVTLFGESSGAVATLGLHVSPLAQNIYHNAIAESGIPISLTVEAAEQGGPNSQNASLDIADIWFPGGNPDREDFENLSLETIYNAYRPNGETIFPVPSMIQDGIVLPEGSVFEALSNPANFSNRPLMIGSNRDEAKLFYAFDEEFVDTFLNIPYIKDGWFYDAFTDALSRTWRIAGVKTPAERLDDDNFSGLYSYRFDWDEEGNHLLLVDVSRLLGATHIIEIPFVFGVFEGFLGDASELLFKPSNEAGRLELSEQMMSYWAEFAYSGDPGRGRNGDLHLWTPTVTGPFITSTVLDTDAGGGVRTVADVDTLQRIFDDVSSSWRINQAEKCRTAQEMNKVFGVAAPELADFEAQMCN